jgi:hypothetical protein
MHRYAPKVINTYINFTFVTFFILCIGSRTIHAIPFRAEFEAALTSHDSEWYNRISKELEALSNETKPEKNKPCRVTLVTNGKPIPKYLSTAPSICTLLHDIVTPLAKKAGMPVPAIGLSLYVDSERAYAAHAYSTINTIYFDADCIKLFTWMQPSINYLIALAAHELGHIYHKHFGASKPDIEYQADTFAVKSLNTPEDLITALNMILLTGGVSNRLIENQFNSNDAHSIAATIAHTLILTSSNFGSLEHAELFPRYFSALYEATDNAIIESLKNSSFDLQEFCLLMHVHCKNLCASQDLSHYAITIQATTSNITHPSPKNRKNHILACIAMKKNGNLHIS